MKISPSAIKGIFFLIGLTIGLLLFRKGCPKTPDKDPVKDKFIEQKDQEILKLNSKVKSLESRDQKKVDSIIIYKTIYKDAAKKVNHSTSVSRDMAFDTLLSN